MYRNIILATDFSKHSLAALGEIKKIGDVGGCKVTIIHVIAEKDVQMFANMEGFYTIHFDEIKDKIERHLRSKAEKEMDSLVEELLISGFEVDSIIMVGKPHREIIIKAKELCSDLIAIGSHGKSQIEEMFLGSTTEKILRQAPCPVLVVRA